MKLIDPPVVEDKLRNLISKARKDYAIIVEDFNRGLQEIKLDGTFDAIVKRHGFTSEIFPKDLK